MHPAREDFISIAKKLNRLGHVDVAEDLLQWWDRWVELVTTSFSMHEGVYSSIKDDPKFDEIMHGEVTKSYITRVLEINPPEINYGKPVDIGVKDLFYRPKAEQYFLLNKRKENK